MPRERTPTFAETRLTPEKRLEIAKAVAARFQPDGSWLQGEWCSCANDIWGYMAITELSQWQNQDANCFCLGAAIRIETQRAIPEITDIYTAGGCDEAMAMIYAQAAGIHVTVPTEPGPHGDPAISAVIDWNDAPGRAFDQVRLLVSTVAALCHADLPIDWTGRRILSADKDLTGIVIEASRGVELKIKWDHLDEGFLRIAACRRMRVWHRMVAISWMKPSRSISSSLTWRAVSSISGAIASNGEKSTP